MIENWPFYILQKVEPTDYDDSVKNDKDFDVSPKLNVTCRLYLFSNSLRRLYVFPRFTRVSCLLARVLSCLTLQLRGKKDESGNERESTASHLFAWTRCLTTPRFSACYLSPATYRLHDSRAFRLHGLHVTCTCMFSRAYFCFEFWLVRWTFAAEKFNWSIVQFPQNVSNTL